MEVDFYVFFWLIKEKRKLINSSLLEALYFLQQTSVCLGLCLSQFHNFKLNNKGVL